MDNAVNGLAGAPPRTDHLVIADFVEPRSRVLDVGCGDGQLLKLLEQRLGVDGRGVEISQKGVNECVARGLSVVQGDADTDLADYPDGAFDYVVLSQTLQATYRPRDVLEQLLRIGGKVIVSIPNFGYWQIRTLLLIRGRMPFSKDLPHTWYDTPNIHFCTIRDFVLLCEDLNAKIEKATALKPDGSPMAFKAPWWFWNLFGQQAVFLLSR